MSYVEQVRDRLIGELGGHETIAGWGVTAERLIDAYTLPALTTGAGTTSADIHDAWAVVTSRSRPEHRSVVPFYELASEVRAMDDEFRDAVIAAAGELT